MARAGIGLRGGRGRRPGLRHGPRMSRPALPAPGARLAVLVFVLALAVQWPLVANPGYFSHDELQWAAFAAAGTPPGWGAFDAFQYRPLTFALWMALSRALFELPVLFHAAVVALGSLNAALLALAARGFGLPPRAAALAALGFVLSPFAAYAHGWVGCLADLLWVAAALALALAVQHLRRPWQAALAAALATALGLLAKEAALAIPALLAVAWAFDRARRPRWLAAGLASGAVAALYLALRLPALLHAPRSGGHYTLGLAQVPLRWLEYPLFAPLVPALETFTLWQRPWAAALAALLWLALLWALWRSAPRLLALWLLGTGAALLPVLPLGAAWNHYAYGAAAVAAPVLVAAWGRARGAARAAIAAYAVLSVLHGLVVMLALQRVGRLQAVFSPALAAAVAAQPDGRVLRLRPAPGARAWVFQRLTHDIPRYAGVAIGTRVALVPAGAAADYEIAADGRLHPLPR